MKEAGHHHQHYHHHHQQSPQQQQFEHSQHQSHLPQQHTTQEHRQSHSPQQDPADATTPTQAASTSAQGQAQKLPACDRCKTRKIKCDGSVPSCAACNKARVECVGRDKLPSAPRGLIHELRKRIRELEASLEVGFNHTLGDGKMAPPPSKRPRMMGEDGNIGSGATLASSPSASPMSDAQEPRGPKQWMLGSMADYLDPSTSLSGSSSENSPDWELAIELRFLAELRRDAVAQISQMSITQRADLTAYEPKLVDRLTRRYLSFLNDTLPIFHEPELIELVATVRNNIDVTSSRKSLAHLVIALAFATLARAQHRSSELARCAKLHWTVAQATVPSVMQRADIAKLQVTLLMLQYTLLFPESGNSWELSGSALRLAAALSLYREARDQTHTSSTSSLRRNLFWTAYCLDVSLSVALARPTAICDSWITTKPPVPWGPGEPTAADLVEKIHPSFLEHVRLRRIQSSIYHHLYAHDEEADFAEEERTSEKRTRPCSPSARDQPHDPWFQEQLAKLTEWRGHFKQATPFVTAQWTELNFQITRTLMFRPSPRVPFPSVSALMEALDSSSKTIKLYKLNHRTSRINFPWLATHHVFMAGLTYLHSLKSLHDLMIPTGESLVDVTMHVQSCASLLEALNTIQDEEDTHKVRDAFDAAAYAVLNNLFAARNEAPPSMFAAKSPTSPNAAVSVPPGRGWQDTRSGSVSTGVSSRLDDLATSAVMALPSTINGGSADDGTPMMGSTTTAGVSDGSTLSAHTPISGVLNGFENQASTPTRSTSFALDGHNTVAGPAPTSTTAGMGQSTNDGGDFAFLDWFLHPIDTRGDWIASGGLAGMPTGTGAGSGALGGASTVGVMGSYTVPPGAATPSNSGAGSMGGGFGLSGLGSFWDEKTLDWM